MKSIQELYNEIMESQELKAQFLEAAKAGKQEAFLKEHGCEATLEDVKAFLEAKQQEDAPLSFDELENAAGGNCATTQETPFFRHLRRHLLRRLCHRERCSKRQSPWSTE